MTVRAVHWHDGMFLRSHHFQTAQRYESHMVDRNDRWNVHYGWGVRAIEIDLDALANYRFAVRKLKSRLPDGTTVAIPEDGNLPPLDLKNALEQESSVTIYLGVPSLSLGKANIAARDAPEPARFLLQTQELEDENTGVNPQKVQVRLLNLHLLVSGQDLSGFEVLPLARVEKSPRAEAAPQLDESYIPPLLACDAWPPLQGGILQSLCDRIGKKIEVLSGQVVARGIGFDSTSQGAALLFAQLRALNEVYPYLRVLSFAAGVHPFTAYVELCQLIGKLAVFGPTRRPPEVPLYDHDDLGGCFYSLKRHLDALLEQAVEPEYKERSFVGAGLRMEVALEPHWLEPIWELYVGVQSSLDPEECVRLLTRSEQLDMKIGSADRVDTIYRLGEAGLRFTHCPHPPEALPIDERLVFFQVDRDGPGEEWLRVQKSQSLAVRVNENRLAGNLQGQRHMTVKTGNRSTVLQFTLFVLARV